MIGSSTTRVFAGPLPCDALPGAPPISPITAAHFLLFPLPLLSDPLSPFAGGRDPKPLFGFSGASFHIAAQSAKTSLGLLSLFFSLVSATAFLMNSLNLVGARGARFSFFFLIGLPSASSSRAPGPLFPRVTPPAAAKISEISCSLRELREGRRQLVHFHVDTCVASTTAALV